MELCGDFERGVVVVSVEDTCGAIFPPPSMVRMVERGGGWALREWCSDEDET